ncbi:MAG TPA: tetratricopeptide repeat protein, partial [Kofleriaceae bacterium]|nr:tetratricopeptide repeat protein [Kofleriaceae bacterium]
PPSEIRALAAELAHLHADELGDPQGAERGWKAVLEVEPDDAEAFTALADLYRQGERWAELRELLERRATAAVSVDERRSALIEIATLDEEIANDATRAIDTYRRLLDVDPGYLPAYKALDRLYGERKEWAELDAILERSFDSVPATEQLGLLFRRAALHAHHLGDPAGAVDLLEDVVTRAPGHADGRELLEELLAVPALRQRVAAMLEPLYTRDRLWKDLTNVLRIQREAADSPLGALELLARVAAVEEDELGNLRAAFDTWAQGLAADPSDPRPAANLVRLAARTDRWGDAAKALDEAATGVEPHVAIPLLRQLAEISDISLGDNARAIAAYHRLYQAAPHDAEVAGPALVALAGLYTDEERWADLDKVLHLHAEGAPTADARARLLAQAAELEEQKLDDRDAAIATWNQLLADDAEDLDALLALERLYQGADRWKDLAENLRRQADRAEAPADRIALLRRLAEIHEVMLEDQEQAIAANLEILDHDGEDAAALDELARLYQEQERPADRLDILERRLALADARGEHDVVARRHEIARLLAGPLGREPEALDRWAEVLAREPGHEEALAAVQRALGDPDLAARATSILEPLYEATGRDQELTELLWQTAQRDSSVRDRLQRQTRVAQIRERRLGDQAGAFAAIEAAVRTAVAEPELPELLGELDRLAADLGREGDLIAVYRDIADDVLDGELQRRLYLDIADLARAVSNDAALAARYYHKVLDSQPDDRRALGALESIYRQGGPAQAEELYKILAQKTDLGTADPLERKAALAEMAALAGGPLRRTDDAITAWQSVLELDPSDEPAATALEALYRDQGRWADLIDLYERRLGFVESLEEAVALRIKAGQVHEQELRDLSAAADSYAAALSGDPAEPTALAALERMLTEVDVRAQAAEVLEPIYIWRQDWPRLVRIYEVRLDAAGEPAERLELTGQIARLYEEQLEDLEAAFGWYAKVLREEPSEPGVRGQLHRLATILDLWPQLAAVYQGVLDDDRGDAAHLRAIAAEAADIYDHRLDRWDPGSQAYLRALAGFLPPDDDLPPLRELFAGLEQLLTRHGQWRPLATAYNDAITAIDDETWRRELQAKLAALLEQKLGDADGAIDAWRGVLASAADAGITADYDHAAIELDRLYRARSRWYDLSELLTERLGRATTEPAQVELRLALAGVLESELHDPSAAVDQYQEVLASHQPEPAAAALERLLADPDQRGRAAELLEPYYRRRDAWPRLVALLEHQVPHLDDPESKIVALLEVAELHDVRGGDAQRALDAYARAWQIDPARKEVFERLVHHAGLMSAWDPLVAILEQGAASTLEPEASAMALSRVAELHEGPRDDRPAAIAAWRKVLAVAPDDAGALASLDRLLAVEGRPAELVSVVERRAELADDPAQRLTLLHRVAGLYEDVLEQPREAVAAYKNVLAADDTDAAALDALDRLYRQLEQPRELAQILERKLELADDPSIRRHLRMDLAAVAERDLGDGYEAQNQLQAVLAEDPTDDEALAELDRLYQASRMWPELLDILERRATLADDPASHAELEYRAAHLSEHELSEPERAIERYGAVLALVPEHAGALAALEGLLAQDAHLEPAAELLERHYRARGDHDALVRVLERRLEGATDPEERRNLWASLADVHETLRGDLAAAAQVWSRALTENPSDKGLIGPLERLAAARGAWAELATLLDGRLQTGLEPELEHDYAMRLGRIYEEQMQAPALAAGAYQRAASTMVDEAAALTALDRVLWRLGRWHELARVLERLAELSDDPHAADLTFRLGDVRETQLHDAAGAVAAYRTVLDRDHGHQAARASLERLLATAAEEKATILDTLEPLYEADGDWPKLIGILDARLSVVDDAHERAAIHHRIATLAETRTHDHGRALAAAAGWLADDPTSTEALAEVDRLAGHEARWFDVAGWVEEIAGKAGDAALPLWMYAGTVQLDRLGDPAKATASFHQALALDADHLPALEALERTHRSMGEIGPLAAVLARQAELAFDPSAKIDLWREVAGLREQSHDDEGAIAAWEAVVDLADDDRDPLANLARIHERRGDRRALVHDLTRAAAIAIDGAEEKAIRTRIAHLESELGDPAAAAAAWQTVLDLDPTDAAALSALEAVHVAAKDWMAVQDLLARRLDLARTSSDKTAVLTRMAELAERERGAIDDAIAHWYAVLDLDSSLHAAYEQLERLLAKSSRWHDLVELLEKRADVYGTLGDEAAELRTLARMADIWEGPLDNPDEAGDILEKILRREPGSVAALTRLARIHERTGDRAKAADVLQRALALGPTGRDAADLFFRLGELASGDGDSDTARAHFRQALQHEPGHAGAIAALEKLARDARDWPVVADMLERRAAAVAAGGEGDAIGIAIELAGVHAKLGQPAA